jgi:hypothetical protein
MDIEEALSSNKRAGGGGSRGSNKTLSSIGINLSPGTNEVAAGLADGDQNRCRMAQEFYNFLLTQGQTLSNLPFFEVPSVTMKVDSVFNKILQSLSIIKGNDAIIDAENNILFSDKFCFDKRTQMRTDYVFKNKPGVLTMSGVTKGDDNTDIVFYILTLYFDQDKKGNRFVTIDGFCKNNLQNFIGAGIGVDLCLMLCENFNNEDKFKIKYCSVEPLPGVIEWWKRFGFKYLDFSKKGTQGRDIMDLYFPDTQASVPFSQGHASMISDTLEENNSMPIDTPAPVSVPAPVSKQIGFETLQRNLVPENLKGNRGKQWNGSNGHYGGKKKSNKRKKTKRRRLTKVKRSRRRSRRF